MAQGPRDGASSTKTTSAMGVVYRAVEFTLKRPVAIKTLRPQGATPSTEGSLRHLRTFGAEELPTHTSPIPINRSINRYRSAKILTSQPVACQAKSQCL